MPYRKGKTNNPSGRPAGVPNKVTREIRPLLREIVEGELQRVPELMEKLEPRDRIQAVIKLLEYVTPKVSENNEPVDMAGKYPPNTFTQFIEKQVIELEKDVEWRNKKLAELPE